MKIERYIKPKECGGCEEGPATVWFFWNSEMRYAVGTKNRMAQKVSAATTAEAGIVNTQAQTICLATPQRTAERREVEPTPTIAPVIVCVVLTGMPW